MAGGFHGRTTTIVGFSTDPDARGGFGPFTPGFDVVPFGRRRRRCAAADRPRTPWRCCWSRCRARPGSSSRRRATSRRAADLRRGRRADGRRRGPVGPRAHGAPAGDPRARASTPTSTCWARRSAAGSCRCRPWSPTRRCSACCSRASTAARSAATRWRARWAARSWTCWRTARCSPTRASWARCWPRGCASWSGTASSPCARPGRGRVSTSTRGWAAAGTCARRLARRGVLAKDTHGATLRMSPPLVATVDEIGFAVDALARVLEIGAAAKQGGDLQVG